MSKVKICLIADNNYVIPTVVSIVSMIENKDAQSDYEISVLSNNLDQFHKTKIKELESNNVSVNIIDVDVSKYGKINEKTHVSVSALIKFDIANIFKNEIKILYLDGDIIVQKDLSHLYNQDMGDFWVMGVRDMVAEIDHKFNKIIGVDKYFNSGVMLLNLETIRNQALPKKLMQTKLDNPQWPCMDQDSFNFVLKNNAKFLDVKYNAMVPLYKEHSCSIKQINKFFKTNYANFYEMQDAAVIVHFAGVAHLRPWKVINGPMSEIWMKYYNISPYRNIDLNREIFSSDTHRVNNLTTKVDEMFINQTKEVKYSRLRKRIFSVRSFGGGKFLITIFGIKITHYSKQSKKKEIMRTEAPVQRCENETTIPKQKISFKTFSDLSTCIKKNVKKLPTDIDLVVGVPRSGITPAYMIALFLNKKACSLDEFLCQIEPRSGARNIKNTGSPAKKKILIVDDSIYGGNALKSTKEALKSIDTSDLDIQFLAVYAVDKSKNLVDYYFEIVEPPRIFQWNYLNHNIASYSCFDIDGVLCVDPTEEQNDDGEKYIDFILNAAPLFIPTYKINSLVTSRLEKYRPETEQWLKKHNIEYDNLYMLNLKSKEERLRLNAHASFKASIYEKVEGTILFIESERKQAQEIAKLTKKPCICTETDEYFTGEE